MERITPKQFSHFFMAFSPMAKLLFLPPLLSLRIQNDLWIALALCFFLDGMVLLFLLLAARQGAEIRDVISSAFGRVGGKIICAFYVLFFFAKTFLFFGEEGRFVTVELYETVPVFPFLLPLFFVGIYLATRKPAALGRLANVFVFFALFSLIALFLLALPSAKWQDLLPVAHRSGKEIYGAAAYALMYFGDPLYLFFLLGKVNLPKKGARKVMGGYLLSALTVVCFSALFYAVFTVLSGYETTAYYNVAKYGGFSSASGRMDLVFTYVLRSVSAIGLSLPGYFAMQALLLATGKKNALPFALVFYGVAAAACLYFYPVLAKAHEGLREAGVWACLAVQYLLPLYAICVFFIKKRGVAPCPFTGKFRTKNSIKKGGQARYE